jgi:micrococcal nuclease
MKYQPYVYNATIDSIYDGDTITVTLALGFGIELKKQKIRLLGIDTPEIRGGEREEGLKSKARLVELIEGKEITLVTHKDKTGKYGRWLGTIYVNETNINEQLIQEGFARPY